jgi:hypothetical protein
LIFPKVDEFHCFVVETDSMKEFSCVFFFAFENVLRRRQSCSNIRSRAVAVFFL